MPGGDLWFVTSFDQSLFQATGKALLRTFLERQRQGVLICCFEDFKEERQPPEPDPRILSIDLTGDPWVEAWDREYRKACEESKSSLWNRRAWQWFRKAASLRRALAFSGRFLTWLDCDVQFLAPLDAATLEGLLDGAGVLYLKGVRGWTETGVVVYDLAHPVAQSFLEEFFRCYESGECMKFERRDDCWIFDRVRERFPAAAFRDIGPARKTHWVVMESPLGQYFYHDKGYHHRKGVR